MKPQANLRQRCPDLQLLADGTAETILRWVVDTARAYRICQDRHGRLVEATAPLAEPGKVDYSIAPKK